MKIFNVLLIVLSLFTMPALAGIYSGFPDTSQVRQAAGDAGTSLHERLPENIVAEPTYGRTETDIEFFTPAVTAKTINFPRATINWIDNVIPGRCPDGYPNWLLNNKCYDNKNCKDYSKRYPDPTGQQCIKEGIDLTDMKPRRNADGSEGKAYIEPWNDKRCNGGIVEAGQCFKDYGAGVTCSGNTCTEEIDCPSGWNATIDAGLAKVCVAPVDPSYTCALGEFGACARCANGSPLDNDLFFGEPKKDLNDENFICVGPACASPYNAALEFQPWKKIALTSLREQGFNTLDEVETSLNQMTGQAEQVASALTSYANTMTDPSSGVQDLLLDINQIISPIPSGEDAKKLAKKTLEAWNRMGLKNMLDDLGLRPDNSSIASLVCGSASAKLVGGEGCVGFSLNLNAEEGSTQHVAALSVFAAINAPGGATGAASVGLQFAPWTYVPKALYDENLLDYKVWGSPCAHQQRGCDLGQPV